MQQDIIAIIATSSDEDFRSTIFSLREDEKTAKQEDFKIDFRSAILDAADKLCKERGVSKVTDSDLPNLFKALDRLSCKLVNS